MKEFTVFHMNGRSKYTYNADQYEITQAGVLTFFAKDRITTVAVFAPGQWSRFEKKVG